MSKNGVVHGLDFLTAECVAPFRFCCYQSFILLPVWEGNLFEEKERGGLAVQILAGNLYPSHAAMHNGHKRTIFSVLVCHLPAVDWLHWLVIHGYPFLGVREAANGHDLLVDLMCIYNIYIQYIYIWFFVFPNFQNLTPFCPLWSTSHIANPASPSTSPSPERRVNGIPQMVDVPVGK